MGLFSAIFKGLKKTKDAISGALEAIFKPGELTDEFYEDLETILLGGDVGLEATEKIIEDLRVKAKKQKLKTCEDVKVALRESIAEILSAASFETNFPLVLTVVGVNGVGKTTNIGKMAAFYKKSGKDVVLCAGDTFRAAASAQLTEWSERAKVKIVKHSEGADPAAVVFDAIKSAKSKNADVLIIDTAGRLHNNVNLMEELKKINRIVSREYGEACHKNLLVIDATTGQNALSQVEYFNNAVGIDGIILTKLDGTANGGVVINIMEKYKTPVVFVGVGEGLDDLEVFSAKDFAESFV